MAASAGTVIATGLGFTEGPVIRQRGDFVVASISQGSIFRIDGSEVALLARVGGGPNGLVEGDNEKIYVAQNGRGWPYTSYREVTGGVQVVNPDGSVEYVTTDPVSPNDLCFGPDGLLYVTDPTRPKDRATGRVWQVNVETGDTEILAQMDWYPNGIGFGLDPDTLIVADSTNGQIVRYPLSGRHLGKGDPFITVAAGHPDGFDFDTEGNLVLAVPSAGEHGEIQTWSMEGKLLDVFVPGPARLYTNLALNADGVLILTNSSDGTVIRFDGWPAVGLPLFPFRGAS